jgi:hypothetical protein
VKAKLTQLSTQDLCWVPDAYSILGRNEHRDNLHCITSQWFRPNLLCCHQHDHHHRSTLLPESSMASDVYLEPVIQVHLLGHITLLAGEEAGDSPYLKFAEHLWPHSSSQDLPPVVGGSATETIGGEVDTQHDLLHYANISYEQLGEIILPHAVDRLRENVTATSYKVLWRSKHGRAYLHAEKTSWPGSKRSERRHGFEIEAEQEEAKGASMDEWPDQRIPVLVDGVRACPVAGLSRGLGSQTGTGCCRHATAVISKDYFFLHP